MIKEIIVVEGKSDICAVRRAVDAELIATGGFGFPSGVEERIRAAASRRGIIVFTDPDFAGEKIRKRVSKIAPGCKHAFLPREEAMCNGDIGIENASPQSILRALAKVRSELETPGSEFSRIDLLREGLDGDSNAARRRDRLGALLGIGYGNAKQFLNRLNSYGVKREEFELALGELEEE
ncbi:MAG: ribonuclease M5 [Peptoclostridium sp.]|uniref:ribonuclease M5 n=1 Tax=Peptoclostridium sp. TaxID=1904860 RepID=UPI00139B2776|nr:ribonuclease M5 [Peptoclostridium sp.]MZQ74823.1 ribonuclease M5 [Peptoclostridium sp.]